MAKAKFVEVVGIEEVQKLLDEILPKHSRNILRAAVHGVAAQVTKKSKSNIKSMGIEKTGNLRKSIKTKRRRSTPDNPVSETYVTQGAGEKNDGFYWRFVEHGTQTARGQEFLRPAVDEVKANMSQYIEAEVIKKIAQAAKKEQKKRAKR